MPRPPHRFAPIVAACVLLGACTQFPDLDARLDSAAAKADYPALVPVEPLLAGTEQAQITPQTHTDLTARISALRARAARLRGTVIDSATRTRMASGVSQ